MSLWVETATAKIVTPHPFQMIALLAPQREIAIVTGQGWGKSAFACVWLADGMVRNVDGEYMFTEPTYDMVERIAIPNFQNFVKNTELEGDWISKKHHIYGTDFGKIYFLSTEKPENLQGSHIKRAVMDEAGRSPFYAYQMIKNRTNLHNGQVLAISNPYRSNDPWLFTHIKARYDQGDPEVLYLTSPSIWNPSFDRKRFEKDKQIIRPEDFAFYYLGIYTKPEGLVFPYNREDVVKDVKYDGQVCFAGADFGTGDPTVLLVGFINTTGLHIIDEYYKQDVDITTHAEAFASYIKKYKIKEIFYDPSAIAYVRQMEREFEKLKVTVKFTRGQNDIRKGIEYQTRLFRQSKLTISPKCYRMLEEDMNYIWKPNGELPDKNNHCEDARRYLVVGVWNLLTRSAPEIKPTKVEEKTQSWIEEHFQQMIDAIQNPKKSTKINWLKMF